MKTLMLGIIGVIGLVAFLTSGHIAVIDGGTDLWYWLCDKLTLADRDLTVKDGFTLLVIMLVSMVVVSIITLRVLMGLGGFNE